MSLLLKYFFCVSRGRSAAVAARVVLVALTALAVQTALTAFALLPGSAHALTPVGNAATGGGHKILIVGDSLSAEYGLPRGTGWVALLEKQLAKDKSAAVVINASVSGETTAGGLARLPALLARHAPQTVVLELGGNDALRGLDLKITEQNLAKMAQLAQDSGAQVLLLGMQIPPNFGKAYAADFAALFSRVSKAQGLRLVPFFLKGVGDATLAMRYFQADRIHPNETAQPIMLGNVYPELRKMLK